MEELLSRYTQILDLVLEKIKNLPRFPDHITDVDVDELTVAMRAMDIKNDYGDLHDKENFMKALGDVIFRAMKKIEDLRPSDPVLEKIEKLKNIDETVIDEILEVGKGEL